jgi:mersacidin/lichenicidin family type 2 lantibiotic
MKEDAMTKKDIIRAWKDEEYRTSLSEAERAKLPKHPAGLIELTDVELATVAGGKKNNSLATCSICKKKCKP